MDRTSVILLPSPHMKTCAKWSALQRKRKTIWHHAARNELITQVAQACLSQDRKRLKEWLIPDKRKKLGMWTHRVDILVENVTHAEAIGELLQSWDVHSTMPSPEPSDEDGEPGTLLSSGSIITWMHAVRHGITADYLIRATGWRGTLDPDADIWSDRSRRGMVVVDFDDAWDAQASKDTDARIHEYQEQGITVVRGKQTTDKK